MSRFTELFRFCLWIDKRANSLKPVVRRYACSTSMPAQVYRYCKRCLKNGCVLSNHQFETKLFTTIFNERRANQSPTMRSHKIDDLRGNALRCTNEIALIFAVLI